MKTLPEHWNAKWIAPAEQHKRHPVFFRSFSLSKPVREATLYITGYGLFEAYLNGQKLGEDVLTPFFDLYAETTQVLAFDLTHLLETDNRMEILLGNGWYKGRFGFAPRENRWGECFAALAQLEIIYMDDSRETVGTDESWSCRLSEILDSGIYDGEYQDYTASAETVEVQILPLGTDHLIGRDSPGLTLKERLAVKKIQRTPAGETVLDFGQNFAGWVEFTAALPHGCKITLEFGEILQKGEFYNGNLRTANARFTVVGDGTVRTFHPHFTYYGFRYVRVTGWPGDLSMDSASFTGRALYSDLARTGWFQCGNKEINSLYKNILWSQRSNFIDIPTDCPQRDERLPWTGDAQVFASTACFNMDCREFYPHFLRLLRQDQEKRGGGIASYLPYDPMLNDPAPVWGDCAVILPVTLYEHYGDISILEKNYPMMRDWMAYLEEKDREHGGRWIWNHGFQFGDWLALDGITPNSFKGSTEDAFVSTLYWYHSAVLMIQTAEVLKHESDHLHFEETAKKIRQAVLAEYFTPSGRLAVDTQTAYLLCLRFGLYADKEKLLEGLRKRLAKDCYQITSGFAAAPLICSVLADNGLVEEAMRMLLREEFPGWLYQIRLGATTIWERWNSMLPDGTVNPSGMNSFNHYAYGSIGQFLYENIAGLKGAAPGFSAVRFAPVIDARLGWCKAAYDSINGRWESEWRLNLDGSVTVRLLVPEGCFADILLPGYDKGTFRVESGEFTTTYSPAKDYLHPFGAQSLVEDLLQSPEAKELLFHSAPAVAVAVRDGYREIIAAQVGQLPFPPYLAQRPEENASLIASIQRVEANLFQSNKKRSSEGGN